MQIENYINAAFAAHHDSKSHSGVVLFIAGVLVYASSRKQKCVTKSPTESELVALTDNLGLTELFHEFVEFIMASQIKMPVVYQDSTSVIQMVTTGGGIVRIKHMRDRMNLAREKVQQQKLQILHCKAALMKADGLTKPLEGQELLKFAQDMLCKP
jgi:hypothetical protein